MAAEVALTADGIAGAGATYPLPLLWEMRAQAQDVK